MKLLSPAISRLARIRQWGIEQCPQILDGAVALRRTNRDEATGDRVALGIEQGLESPRPPTDGTVIQQHLGGAHGGAGAR